MGYSLLLAHNQARHCLHADIWRLVGMALALFLALPHGLPAYFAGLLIVHTIALMMVLYWLFRGEGLHLSGVFGAFVPAGVSAALAVVAAELLRHFAFGAWPRVPLMIAYGGTFGLIYMGALRVFFAPLLYELVGYLPKSGQVHRLLGYAAAA